MLKLPSRGNHEKRNDEKAFTVIFPYSSPLEIPFKLVVFSPQQWAGGRRLFNVYAKVYIDGKIVNNGVEALLCERSSRPRGITEDS